MADPDFTLTVTGARNLGGGARIVYGTFTSDGGTYVAGGHEPTGGFDGIDQIANEQPTFVLFASTNGWNYEYNNSTEKVLIRSTDPGGNFPHAQHTAAAVTASARTGVSFLAFWIPKVGRP